MCATKTCSSVLAVSAPTPSRRKRPWLVKMMTFMIEVFQEALDMWRAAQRRYFLSDE
jgi:hypothetical protein